MVDTDNNWIKLHRNLIVNELWRSEPFSKGQAWVDLLLLANFDYGYFFNRGIKIDVQRGQVGMSELQLSIRWKWSRTKVRSFFKLLVKEQQIIQHINNVNSLITITNYDIYQTKKQEKVQQEDNRSATEVQQQNTNKNDKNENKDNKEPITPSSPTGEAQEVEGVDYILTKKKKRLRGKRFDTFKTFWDAFGYKSGKAGAADSWLEIPLMTYALVVKIVEGAKQEASRRPALVSQGRTPIMAQGWITGKRWEDAPTLPPVRKIELSY